MRLSVVIPTYNARATIAACLESLAAEGVPSADAEAIVADDASTDGTADLVAGRFPGVRTIRLERNAGAYAARNAAIEAARGEVLAFTDADCVALPGWAAAIRARVGPETPVVM